MPIATVRLNGVFGKNTNNSRPVSFNRKRVKLKTVISKMTIKVSDKSIAFFAINGTKAVKDSWVSDGDVIDIFPVVAGG